MHAIGRTGARGPIFVCLISHADLIELRVMPVDEVAKSGGFPGGEIAVQRVLHGVDVVAEQVGKANAQGRIDSY